MKWKNEGKNKNIKASRDKNVRACDGYTSGIGSIEGRAIVVVLGKTFADFVNEKGIFHNALQ